METAGDSMGCSLLVDWANQQDNWIRAIVAQAVETRQPFTPAQLGAIYEMFLSEKELSAEQPTTVPLLTTKPDPGTAEDALVLETLGGVENVNALAAGQSIAFNPRMNVLFGENGTGKTGYVRILKSIAAVRTEEAVLPDVNRPSAAQKPRATIEYRIGPTKTLLTWNGESGLQPLTRIDLFDNRGVLLHVDQELTYTYTPSDLAVFRLVHEAIEQVRQRLEQAREEKQPKTNPFTVKFARDTTAFTAIEALGASTDIKQLETLATIKPEEEAELQSLRERVDALRSTSTDARLQIATAELDLLRRVLRVRRIVSALSLHAYNDALAALLGAKTRYKRATEEVFAADDIPAALGDAWRAFVEAGERYLLDIGNESFPVAGEPCIYCRQPLDNAAVVLLKKYREFCNNALRTSVEEAREATETLTNDIRNLDLARLGEDVQKQYAVLQPAPGVFDHIRSFIQKAHALQDALKSMQPFDDSEFLALAVLTRSSVIGRFIEVRAIARDLRQQSTSRTEALDRESTKLKNLEARLTLYALLPDIKAHVEAAKWADRAGAIAARIGRTTAKSLTEASKLASEQLLNHDFEKLFQAECRALRAPRVSLDFPGRKGQPARRKSLPANYKLSDVLSEGEQKVIALADFIAEASLRRHASPVVFDDPVNSLDYKRLHYVVDRLIQISESRQVIIFTHNIWFTMEVLTRFDEQKEACAYYDVSDPGDRPGTISRGKHPRADTYNSMKGRINALVQDAAAAKTTEARDALIEKAYEVLRGICEVIVESELLQGVTQRYQPNVMMTKLDKIKADRLPSAIAAIVPVFDKACRYIASHSQPLETLNVRPSLEEFRDDWQAIQNARNEYLNA